MDEIPQYQPGRLSLTKDDGPLTKEQREFYEKNGFVLIKNVFGPHELDYIHQHYVEICRNPEKYRGKKVGSVVKDIRIAKGEQKIPEELPKEYSSIKLNFFNGEEGVDEVFCSFLNSPKLLKYVKQFVKSDKLTTAHHMYICKPPGLTETNRHPLHQDLLYFPQGKRAKNARLASKDFDSIIAAWCSLGKVTQRNGCLTVIPGSHWQGLREHGYPKWEKNNMGFVGVQGLTDEEIGKRVHLEMDDGDVVFFHPELIHGSGYNKVPLSEKDSEEAFRKAIAVHFVRDELEYVDYKDYPKGAFAAFSLAPSRAPKEELWKYYIDSYRSHQIKVSEQTAKL